MRVKLIALLGLNSVCGLTLAANLGVYGELFPVQETDIRQVIMSRLQQMEQTGELKRHQDEVQRRVSQHILRPTPLNLKPTRTPHTFLVNPEITVNQDIWAPNGLQVARRGTVFNPLAYVTFTKTLLFFNGDDKHQVAWVQAHYQDYRHVKFILTGGDVRDAANRFGRIYFDMEGRLSERLHIKHVPSVVRQAGREWNIQEIGVKDA